MLKNLSAHTCYAYLNLHSKDPKTFSIQQNGLVTENLAQLIVNKGKFLVRKGGHSTAVKEQTRNVHAFVVFEPKELQLHSDSWIFTVKDYFLNQVRSGYYIPVHYHYNNGAHFSIKFGDEYIPLAEDYEFRSIIMLDHKCYLPRTVAYEYIVSRMLTAQVFLDANHPGFSQGLIKIFEKWIDQCQRFQLQTLRGFHVHEGICSNLSNALEDIFPNPAYYIQHASDLEARSDAVLNHAFNTWEKFSGHQSYPISPTDQPVDFKTAHNYYCQDESKWYHKQGRQRVELLKHIIHTIKNV